MDYYGVIGNPIQHSKSPLIHRLFAEQTNQQLVYVPILVALEQLPTALLDFQTQQGRGVNITSPFKQSAFELVNQLSDRARRARAVNTIRFDRDGVRFGDNTDGVGLVRDITQNQRFAIRGKQVLLLGAGGAVSGVIDAILREEPAQLIIANRTESKAVMFAEQFVDSGAIRACGFSALKKYVFDLVINGTSASLSGESLELPVGILNQGGYCYDMVYGQGVTPFLTWAQKHAAAIYSDGLGMLVEQAAESFFLWRGVRPDTKPVLSVLSDASSH